MDFSQTHAIVRRPGPDAASGLTSAQLGPADMDRLLSQHAVYVGALRTSGLHIVELPALPGCPDAYFVEDAAIMVPGSDHAVLTRPGAAARRPEVAALADTVSRFRKVERIEAPGTLDGGDVLFVGTKAFIGLSARTNRSGADQLSDLLTRWGFDTHLVPVAAGLHFKSSVSLLDASTLVVAQGFAGHPALQAFQQIVLEADQESAANLFRIGDRVFVPAGSADLVRAIETRGLQPVELDMSEVAKMDGGLTCMSLRFSAAT